MQGQEHMRFTDSGQQTKSQVGDQLDGNMVVTCMLYYGYSRVGLVMITVCCWPPLP